MFLKDKEDNMKIKTSVKDIFFFIILCLVFFIYFVINVNTDKDFGVYLIFFINSIFAIGIMCLFEQFISAIKLFFAFVLVFLVLAPFLQYSNGTNLWNHTNFIDSDYLISNILILFSNILVILAYLIRKKRKKKNYSIKIDNNTLYILFLVLDIVAFLYCLTQGLLSSYKEQTNDTILTSVNKIIRFIPAATLIFRMLYAKFSFKKINLNSFSLFTNIIIFLVLFFPLNGSVPRFLLFGTYLSLMIPLMNKIKIKAILPVGIFLFFVVVFPIFNVFKSGNSLLDWNFSSDYLSYYNSVDFDAYQMFMETIKMVQSEGVSFGGNILSAILFFVPRSIWNGKLEMTGSIIAQFFGHWFHNLSCPYIAEFYFAFGILGVIVGSVFIGCLFKIVDCAAISNNIFSKGMSLIFMGVSIYWLRGSLLTTNAFLFALLISYFLACFIPIMIPKTQINKQIKQ